MTATNYDALLIVSFGGPEGPDEVMPFLENVVRGRHVPRERLLAVAKHYQHFGGISPLNSQNRQLAAAIQKELDANGPKLKVYLGNRNWHPFLADTLRQMRADGIRRSLAFVTSAFGSYSSCRQYLENIAAARDEIGAGAATIDKLRAYFNHPGFIEAMADRTRAAMTEIPSDRRKAAQLIFTAHSIPLSMAAGCQYEAQLREASRLVAATLALDSWQLAFQSRSGPPTQPWLEPDVNDTLRSLAAGGARDVIIVPIGFVSDHMEVVYDLDTEATQTARSLKLNMVRAKTVGTHPRFVQMIRELILERTASGARLVLGGLPPSPDDCAADCCLLRSPSA
jgi:protoporphyrin/coproporphyrin ferrochelatase